MTCVNASATPFEIWRSGSEKVVSGSRIENLGKTKGLMKASFSGSSGG